MFRRHVMHGWLTVVTGCMASGKSSELRRLIVNSRIAGKRIKVFKPETDTRTEAFIASRDGGTLPATPVKSAADILSLIGDAEVVGIDEAQFFDFTIVAVAEALVKNGIDVIIAGLDTDFRGDPFGSMPALLALADQPVKVYAVCSASLADGKVCGGPGVRSQLLLVDAEVSAEGVLIGGDETYAPRCRDHFVPPAVHRAGSE